MVALRRAAPAVELALYLTQRPTHARCNHFQREGVQASLSSTLKGSCDQVLKKLRFSRTYHDRVVERRGTGNLKGVPSFL
jgi:hypothetical protein